MSKVALLPVVTDERDSQQALGRNGAERHSKRGQFSLLGALSLVREETVWSCAAPNGSHGPHMFIQHLRRT